MALSSFASVWADKSGFGLVGSLQGALHLKQLTKQRLDLSASEAAIEIDQPVRNGAHPLCKYPSCLALSGGVLGVGHSVS